MKLEELLTMQIHQPDDAVRLHARNKWDVVAKPVDSLGDFEDIICKIAAIQKRTCPDLSKKAHIIMCADNGVVSEGVSQVGQSVTYDMAVLMGERKSSVGVMTSRYLLDIYTYDVGINSKDTPEGVIDRKVRAGTADFVKEPAMSETECLAAIETGIEAVRICSEQGYKIISTGEMGIGNTTTSTAFLCAVLGGSPEECTGKGTGLTAEGLERKIRVIKQGIALHVGEGAVSTAEGAFEALRCLGGLDIAALAGVFIGGAVCEIPIVIDGLISSAAALAAEKIVPGCREYMIASHIGREKGTAIIQKELDLRPVIHADMALGEGTGAVMLFPLLDMAALLQKEGTTFGQAAIEQCERPGI